MADQPGRGRGRGLLMARLAAKKSEESSSSRAGDTSSDADTTVSEPGAGRARGRGSLLRQLQSQRYFKILRVFLNFFDLPFSFQRSIYCCNTATFRT